MTLREHFEISKRAVRHAFSLDKQYTVCMIICAFLSSVTGYIPIYFSAKVVDALYGGEPLGTVVQYVILTVGLVFAVRLTESYISSLKNIGESRRWRNENWMYTEKAMQMAYESIEDPEVLKLRYRTKMDSQSGFNCYVIYRALGDFISSGTRIVASIAMTASFFTLTSLPVYIKAALVFGMLMILLVSNVSTTQRNKINSRLADSRTDSNVFAERYSNYINDYGTAKDVRMYGMSDFVWNEYSKFNTEFFGAFGKFVGKRILWSLPGTVVENVFKLGVYAVLIWAAIGGGITVGDIAKYVACIMLLIGAVRDMITALNVSLYNHQYLKRYFSYFDIPNNMYNGSLTVEKRDDNEYDIEFRDVSFKYPNTEAYALRHVNLKFKIGEKLAIVGMNGSGKTTFIKLLCRLYDPCEGEILLNGVNIKKYDYDEYMSIFSVVFQDFNLFAFKLGEVVASSMHFDKERVRKCLEKANFGDRFAELPKGADTYLYKTYDRSGIEISGGEAQKIALARALYKDAPFILLDEPTAALDPISEYEVYSNFNAKSGDKTTVYISHRLASCRF